MTRNALRLYLSRLLTVPAVRVIERGEGRSLVAVDGLVCETCADRASRALADVEGCVTSRSTSIAASPP